MAVPFDISESKYVKNLVFISAYESLPTNRERLGKYDMYRDQIAFPNKYCVSVVWHARDNTYEVGLISSIVHDLITVEVNDDWFIDQTITNMTLEQVESFICGVAAMDERTVLDDEKAGLLCILHMQKKEIGSDYRDRTRYCIGCNPEKFETEDTTLEI